MNRMILIAAGLMAAAPVNAMAARVNAAHAALDASGALGVLQQGRGGGGGGKEEGGGRGQGGGGQGGGRDEARPERRQGGGQSERRQQPERAESSRGRSSSSGSSEARRSGGSAGRSDDARESRGNGSSSSSSARSERGSGNGASSASSREERGNGSGNSGRGASSGNSSNGNSGSSDADARGGRHRLGGADLRRRVDALPSGLRRMAASSRPSERLVAGAVARGQARGLDAGALDVRDRDGRLSIFNRDGQLLLDLDDGRARDLGGWRLRRLGDRQPAANAPAFCRSGEGHPVGGRQWCLDKGFGLGSRSGTLWSRGSIDDVIWRRRTDDRLDRGGLLGVLGDIVLGRLAFQALSLGYDQPLVGYWVAEPQGPRILRVHSGNDEVAEFVDTNRDDRADVLYVVQPVW